MEQLLEDLKKKIIDSLRISDIKPEEIDPDAPLIGAGLGLDSIDTLEILIILEKDYSIIVPDVNVGRQIFSSLRALAQYVMDNSKKG